MRRLVNRWIVIMAAAVLSFFAAAANAQTDVEVEVRPAQVVVGGAVYDAIWYLPQQVEPAGFQLFGRSASLYSSLPFAGWIQKSALSFYESQAPPGLDPVSSHTPLYLALEILRL